MVEWWWLVKEGLLGAGERRNDLYCLSLGSEQERIVRSWK